MLGERIDLKGGHTAYEPRLGRLPAYDPRNEEYSVRRLLLEDTRTPINKTWACKVWLDQGSEGSCTGFSRTHDSIARPKETYFWDVPVLPQEHPFSALAGQNVRLDYDFARRAVYWRAQQLDDWPGGAYPGADGYYEGTSVLAAAKAGQEMGLYASYHWATSMEELVLAVGYIGPAVIGINWYESMFDVDPSGYVSPQGQVAGGHAICINGVSKDMQRFRLRNSWGASWGINGSCFITWADMKRLVFDEGGEACIATGRVA